jgi:hypothetical protein
MAEIGLCSTLMDRQWVFTILTLMAGAIGFLWLRSTPSGNLMMVYLPVLCFGIGMSFVHFLYDRWLWKMSDKEISRVVGRALGV